MPSFLDIFNKLPVDTQKILNTVWDLLPDGERESLRSVFGNIPADPNLFKLLVDLSLSHLQQAFGQVNAVAIVGPANVGKSTLYNQLVRSKQDRAEVSPLPGTTRVNQQAEAGLFRMVDTPGADAVGEVGAAEKAEALFAAEQADFLLIVFDAIQGIKKAELELFEELTALQKPYLVVVNKMDLVGRESARVIEKTAANLGLKPEQLVAISAKHGKNIEKILMGIAAVEPKIVAALGQALPEYRWQLALRSIAGTSALAAAIALTPLPLIDFIPLTAAQTTLVITIARIYNYKMTLQRARELAATFGLGLLARTLFQELSKLGGLPGWMLSAVIAASTTAAIGFAAATWFEKGEKLTSSAMNRVTKAYMAYLLDRVRGLGKGKPSPKDLQAHIEEALLDAPTIISQPPAE